MHKIRRLVPIPQPSGGESGAWNSSTVTPSSGSQILSGTVDWSVSELPILVWAVYVALVLKRSDYRRRYSVP